MKVLFAKSEGVVEPHVLEQGGTLDEMQNLVGGYIDIVPLDEPFVAIVNEEGAVRELPQNGPFNGPWFICATDSAASGKTFRGLTDEELTLLTDTPEEAAT